MAAARCAHCRFTLHAPKRQAMAPMAIEPAASSGMATDAARLMPTAARDADQGLSTRRKRQSPVFPAAGLRVAVGRRRAAAKGGGGRGGRRCGS